MVPSGNGWAQSRDREAVCIGCKEPVPSVRALRQSFNGQIIQSLCGEGTWMGCGTLMGKVTIIPTRF